MLWAAFPAQLIFFNALNVHDYLNNAGPGVHNDGDDVVNAIPDDVPYNKFTN